MKRAWAAMLVTLAVVLPLKIYAAFNFTGPSVNYYTDGGKMAALAAVLAVVGAVAAMALAYRSAGRRQAHSVRSPLSAVFAVLSGLFIAGQSLVNFVGEQSTTAANILFVVFSFLAAIPFFAVAYDFGSGETTLRSHPLLSLLPSIWGCFCLIFLFIDYAAEVDRIENVYHTFTALFLLLFLFAQAKLLSGMDMKNGKWVFAFGFAAVIFAVTDSATNIVLLVSGRRTLGSFPQSLYVTNLVLALYIAAYMAAAERCRKSATHPATNMIAGSEAPGAVKRPPATSAVSVHDEAEDPVPAEDALSSEDENTAPAEKDVPLECLDFLLHTYPSAAKFIENGKNSVQDASNIKS